MKSLKKGVFQITDGMIGYGMAIVGLIAVISVGAVALLKPNSATEITTITTLVNETRSLRPSTGYGTLDFVPTLINAGRVPKGVTIVGTTLQNKSGGAITIVGATTGIVLASTKVSQGDCITLVSALSSMDMASVKINSGTAFTTDVTAVQANAQCTAGKTNTLTFTTNS